MSIKKERDINDDEIRIISSSGGAVNPAAPRRRRPLSAWLWAAVTVLVIIGVTALLFFSAGDEVEHSEEVIKPQPVVTAKAHAPADSAVAPVPDRPAPYVMRRDTVASGVSLTILTPFNATPVLQTGFDVADDTTAVLMAQAADIRRDNGKVVGAYIEKGELLSKGEAKAGFCSIIGGEITVGVADATPMFEQALMADGYFFRQYPLVVGGQVVENKPKGCSVRKALAELDGRICVIISGNRLTFHDFSQALADLGVTNAIYLVGGDSYGCYKNSSGESFTFGRRWDNRVENVNFIVWR